VLQQKPGIISRTLVKNSLSLPSPHLKLALHPTCLTSSISARHDRLLSIWHCPHKFGCSTRLASRRVQVLLLLLNVSWLYLLDMTSVNYQCIHIVEQLRRSTVVLLLQLHATNVSTTQQHQCEPDQLHRHPRQRHQRSHSRTASLLRKPLQRLRSLRI